MPSIETVSYYSGMVALNLYYDSEWGRGDWHSSAAIIAMESGVSKSDLFIINKKSDIDYLGHLGLDGIVEYSKEIKEMGIKNTRNVVYVATSERAVADMLLRALLRDIPTKDVSVDDWLTPMEQKIKLFKILDNARGKLTEHQESRLDALKEYYLYTETDGYLIM